jgi:hypothetical protein
MPDLLLDWVLDFELDLLLDWVLDFELDLLLDWVLESDAPEEPSWLEFPPMLPLPDEVFRLLNVPLVEDVFGLTADPVTGRF